MRAGGIKSKHHQVMSWAGDQTVDWTKSDGLPSSIVAALSLAVSGTVNSRFKKDLKLQIHLHKAFFSDDRFLDSLHKCFLNQTTLNLRKEKWTFLNREFTVFQKSKISQNFDYD
jgi:hypothetical protein